MCLAVGAAAFVAACGPASSSPSAPSAASRGAVAVAAAPTSFGFLTDAANDAAAREVVRCLQATPQPGCTSVAPMPKASVNTAGATAPGAPTNLQVTVTGQTVILTWNAPTTGDPVTTYVLDAGAAPGLDNLLRQSPLGAGTAFTAIGVAAGTYYVRIRARNDAGTSGPSNEITVTVNVPGVTFNPPGQLPNGKVGQGYRYSFCDPDPGSGLCNGGTSPRGGAPPYHFQLESGVGFPPIGIVLGASGVLTGTPSVAGTSTFRVVAVDLGGTSALKAPQPALPQTSRAQAAGGVSLTIDPACTTPAAPTGFGSTVSGSTVTLRWSAVTGATSYVLQAGSSAGSTNLANADIGNVTSYVATGIGNGTYYIRIRAKNACGDLSAASSEATTVVGPTGGITGFFGRGGCQYFEIFDFWTGCKADVTANITKIVTSGNVGVLLFWNTGGGDGLFHGDLRVTPGSAPGNVTISTTSGSLFRRYCSNAIPVTIEIFDGQSGTGGVGIPLLYSVNSTWTGFGCG
jgi:hypothetical protein